MSKKSFKFFYKGDEQKLKVYSGTSKLDVLRTLFKSFDILEDEFEEEEFKKLVNSTVLLDSDGDVVVFQPDVIPSGESLYLTFRRTVKKEKVLFHWDENVVQQYASVNCVYTMSDDKLTLSGPEDSNRTRTVGFVMIFGNKGISEGVWKWKFDWTSGGHYKMGGVVSEEERKEMLITESWPLYKIGETKKDSLFTKSVVASSHNPSEYEKWENGEKEGGPSMHTHSKFVSYTVDMNKKTLVVSGERGVNIITNIPDVVYPVVWLKGGNNTVTLVFE